ncbi:hypothetical protein [Diaminobutyricibacter sp. McL0608]|uniref:hypothetical protein n=1 Tax=Leifsonia sp. McL0608 TaxID=3143537 RepID=UPI0031F323B0
MDIVDALISEDSGLIRASHLRENGITGGRLESALQARALVRVHRGLYIPGRQWASLQPDARYLLRVRAVALASDRALVFCRETAAAIHGLPIVSPWPDTIHVATPNALGGSSQKMLTAHTHANPGPTVAINGLTATALSRTVVDMAAYSPFVDAVSVIDAALRRNPDSFQTELAGELETAAIVRGARRASRAIEFGDALAESPGESLSRARIHELGLVAPELQVGFDVSGHHYVVDFYWPETNLIGEFDGRAKYTRAEFTAGAAPEEVVWREKKREDALRAATGARVVRWTWATAMNPRSLRRLLTDGGVPPRRR